MNPAVIQVIKEAGVLALKVLAAAFATYMVANTQKNLTEAEDQAGE